MCSGMDLGLCGGEVSLEIVWRGLWVNLIRESLYV